MKAFSAYIFCALVWLTAGCTQPEPERADTALVRRLFEEGYNQRKPALVDELMTPDLKAHINNITRESPDFVKQDISIRAKLIPDFKISIEDIWSCEDKVTAQLLLRGTHGDSGGKVELHIGFIARIEDRKIAEIWYTFDTMALFKQSGYVVVPPGGEKPPTAAVTRSPRAPVDDAAAAPAAPETRHTLPPAP